MVVGPEVSEGEVVVYEQVFTEQFDDHCVRASSVLSSSSSMSLRAASLVSSSELSSW